MGAEQLPSAPKKKKEEEKPGIGALSSLVLGSQGLCTAGQGRPSSQVPAPGGV